MGQTLSTTHIHNKGALEPLKQWSLYKATLNPTEKGNWNKTCATSTGKPDNIFKKILRAFENRILKLLRILKGLEKRTIWRVC